MSAGVRPETQDPKARIRRNVEKMASAGASQEEIETYLQHEGLTPRADGPPVAPRESLNLDVRAPGESTAALPHNRPDRSDSNLPNLIPGLASAPEGILKVIKEPETLESIEGLAVSAAQAIPGMKAVQAGARAATRGQSYREALGDIEGAQSLVPKEVRIASQIPAIAAMAPVLPANPAAAGAVLGGADQALDANPDVGLAERAGRTVVGAAAGATLGKVVDTGVTAARALAASKPGANALARQEAMQAADKVAYGRAEQEGMRAGGSSPQIKNALVDPTIAPFVKAVRESATFANATDAQVLQEAYKLMSETQRRLGRTMVNADDFRAGSSIQKSDIDLGKKKLLAAADPIMPSLRPAIEQHATAAGELEALAQGSATARRVVMKNSGNPNKLVKQSPEAFSKRIQKMTPGEKKAAIEGMLGELRTRIGLQPNMVSMGGSMTTAIRPARVAPYLRELGGTEMQDAIYKMALLSGLGVSHQ